MKYTFPNGVVIEGTTDQVRKAAQAFGYVFDTRGFYNSSTHGLIKVKDMDTRHLRNALLAKSRKHLDAQHSFTDYDLAKSLADGPNDPEYVDLYTEFAQRVLGVKA